MPRPTIAQIDAAALKANVAAVRARLQSLHSHQNDFPICAMVKADAYGHGVELVCPALAAAGIRHWGVHSVAEGIELRGLKLPGEILVLGGIYPDELPAVVEFSLTPVLHHLENLRALLNAAEEKKLTSAGGKKINAHLKLDTGMGRFGFRPEQLSEFIAAFSKQKVFELTGCFAHLPLSENKAYVDEQQQVFSRCLQTLEKAGMKPGVRHHSNSVASLLYPDLHFDLVRPGLVLYGVYPHELLKDKIRLQPVMSFTTQIVSLRDIPKGVGLSYGHTFVTQRPSHIATVPVGYADGYPRACGNRAHVLVRGQRAPVVGRVCMDMSLIDVTDVAGVKSGDTVTLFGSDGKNELDVWEIADICQTIPYEILCGVSPRVPRVAK